MNFVTVTVSVLLSVTVDMILLCLCVSLRVCDCICDYDCRCDFDYDFDCVCTSAWSYNYRSDSEFGNDCGYGFDCVLIVALTVPTVFYVKYNHECNTIIKNMAIWFLQGIFDSSLINLGEEKKKTYLFLHVFQNPCV